MASKSHEKAMKELGTGLHAVQDVSAHDEKYGYQKSFLGLLKYHESKDFNKIKTGVVAGIVPLPFKLPSASIGLSITMSVKYEGPDAKKKYKADEPYEDYERFQQAKSDTKKYLSSFMNETRYKK